MVFQYQIEKQKIPIPILETLFVRVSDKQSLRQYLKVYNIWEILFVMVSDKQSLSQYLKVYNIHVSIVVDTYFDDELVAIKNKQHQTELFWKNNDGSGIKHYNLFWCEQAFGNLCKVMLHICYT